MKMYSFAYISKTTLESKVFTEGVLDIYHFIIRKYCQQPYIQIINRNKPVKFGVCTCG